MEISTELTNQKNNVGFLADALIVKDEASLAIGEQLLSNCNSIEKKIKALLDPFVKAANDAHKKATAERKVHLHPVTDAKGKVARKLSAYANKVRKEAAGKAEVISKATGAEKADIQIPTAIDTGSFRKIWQWEVEDLSKVPAEYLVLDEARINKEVREKRDKCTIPGIKTFDISIAVSR